MRRMTTISLCAKTDYKELMRIGEGISSRGVGLVYRERARSICYPGVCTIQGFLQSKFDCPSHRSVSTIRNSEPHLGVF